MSNNDTMPLVQRFWNESATAFDAIYTGQNKSVFQRSLDRVFRKDMYDRFNWVMAHAGPLKGKTVCDIGCGSGRFVAEFARRGVVSAVGIDVAPKMLTLAHELAAAKGVSSLCRFVRADIADWNSTCKFDITVAVGLWDYIGSPAARLRKIRQVTNERFLSTWPRCWTWRMPIRRFRLAMSRCPVYFYTDSQVHRLLSDSGFHIHRLEVVGKLFCVDARPGTL
jgi:SAM-dependent methyltransferase